MKKIDMACSTSWRALMYAIIVDFSLGAIGLHPPLVESEIDPHSCPT